MKEKKSIAVHAKYAKNYDNQVKALKCHDHDLLFGLCFSHIRHGERLLDLGIGTGLASLPFYKAGLEIFGIDGCFEMLEICRGKKIAKELKLHDINCLPFPYPDNYFNHVIACGFFHFFEETGFIMKEVARIIKPGGIFAFTTKEPEKGIDCIETMMEGTPVFAHGQDFIKKKYENNQFSGLKNIIFYLYKSRSMNKDFLFNCHVVQKNRS